MWRIQYKNIFLTYSQTKLSFSDLFAHILSLYPVSYLILAEEKHQDGGQHFHSFVRLESKPDIRDERAFDFEGHHPSIEKAKCAKKAQNYCKKDGDYEEYGVLGEVVEDRVGTPEASEYSNRLEYLRACQTAKIPYQYAVEFWKAEHVDHGPTLESGEEVIGSLRHPWLETHEYDRTRALVLYGSAGSGKTTYGKLHVDKPCLWIRHIDNLKYFDKNYHRSILFDDLDFNHWPITSQIALVDTENETAINRRYGVTNIPKGFPRIFTCNNCPFDTSSQAILRRIVLKHIFIE